MSSERAALARALLAKKNEVAGGAGVTGKPKRSTPDYSRYSHIHPEVLAHVDKFLQEFTKGLNKNGR